LLVLIVLVLAPYGRGATQPATRPATGEADAPVRLVVMTYNIHHAAGMDGRLDVERIARVIRDARPDLVALQEVDGGTKRADGVMQAQELGRLTEMHHAFGPAMDFGGGKYGNAVLSRFPIERAVVASLPHNPGGQREPRSALGVYLRLPDGRQIAFGSTHFDHTRDGSDRLEQAKKVNEETRDVEIPAVLGGDFNCEPNSAPMRELAKVWTLASGGATGGTALASTRATFPSTQPRISIDHVLVKPRDRWRVVEATVIDEPVASDHRPVVVTLELFP
jgi:endonuclease/exonuclease/phosphatase family metal-dependent hydrolase